MHDLKIGSFATILKTLTEETELLGYYPLALYSRQSLVVPDLSGSGALQPLVLESAPSLEGFLRFAGSSPNIDSKRHNFVLDRVEIPRDVPMWRQSLYFYFDLLAIRFEPRLGDWTRFNVARVELGYLTTGQSGVGLVALDVDLAYKSTGSQTLPTDPAETLHSGQLQIIVSYRVNGVSQPAVSKDFTFGGSEPSTDTQLKNVPHQCYKSSSMEAFDADCILSPQMLILSVAQCARLIRGPYQQSLQLRQVHGGARPDKASARAVEVPGNGLHAGHESALQADAPQVDPFQHIRRPKPVRVRQLEAASAGLDGFPGEPLHLLESTSARRSGRFRGGRLFEQSGVPCQQRRRGPLRQVLYGPRPRSVRRQAEARQAGA